MLAEASHSSSSLFARRADTARWNSSRLPANPITPTFGSVPAIFHSAICHNPRQAPPTCAHLAQSRETRSQSVLAALIHQEVGPERTHLRASAVSGIGFISLTVEASSKDR